MEEEGELIACRIQKRRECSDEYSRGRSIHMDEFSVVFTNTLMDLTCCSGLCEAHSEQGDAHERRRFLLSKVIVKVQREDVIDQDRTNFIEKYLKSNYSYR